MRAEWIKELGLSPLWKRRTQAAASPDSVLHSAETATPAANPTIPAHPAETPAAANRAETPPTPAETAPQPAPAVAAKPDSAPIPAPSATAKPQPDEAIIARMDWRTLRGAVAECRRCALCEKRTQAVFGVGDPEAEIVFVGEGPGYEEDRRGEPFVGPAGRLLDEMLKSIGIGRDNGVYIANIVKCRPPQNRNPKPEEGRACMAFLRRQLELTSPRLVVALGAVAAAHLLQSEEPVGKLRQRLHDYHGVPLVVTYHPAYLLRSPAEKRKSWDDLLYIRRIAAKTG